MKQKIKGKGDEILLIGVYKKFIKIECQVLENDKLVRDIVRIKSGYVELFIYTDNITYKRLYVKSFNKKGIEYVVIVDTQHYFYYSLPKYKHIQVIYKNKEDELQSKKRLESLFELTLPFFKKYIASDIINKLKANESLAIGTPVSIISKYLDVIEMVTAIKLWYDKGQYIYFSDYDEWEEKFKELGNELDIQIEEIKNEKLNNNIQLELF